MDIIPLKRLFLVAGFEGQDLGARVTRLQRHFEGGDHKFVARVYPSNADKRPDYLRKLVKDANNLIFGSDGATNFCRKQDQLCAVAPKEGKGVAKLCERKHVAKAACGRARPQLIVVLCATRIYDEAFERLGRATLLLRFDADQLPDDDTVLTRLAEFEPIAREVIQAINHRSKALYAPLIPFRNFQKLAPAPIAAEVQDDPSKFSDIMMAHHERLYDGAFQNPEKKKIRGAYMLDGETAFQQDHLHKTVQIIGPNSREDVT